MPPPTLKMLNKNILNEKQGSRRRIFLSGFLIFSLLILRFFLVVASICLGKIMKIQALVKFYVFLMKKTRVYPLHGSGPDGCWSALAVTSS